MRKQTRANRIKWQRIALSILCIVLALTLFTMIFVTAFVDRTLGQISIDNTRPVGTLPPEVFTKPTLPSDFTGPTINPDTITIPTAPVDFLKHEKVVNIMLVGQDRRPNENYRTRSDSMILCTFNLVDNTLTMTSFMRDLYVQIPGYGGNKMNAAYQWGGMSLLSETMMLNFGIHVDAFVEVDFKGFQSAIDALGGIDMELTAVEAAYMNENYGFTLKEGINHLNGQEALNYSRIRMVPTASGANNDFGRTERQRRVLTTVINSCKHMGLMEARALLNEMVNMVETDMSKSDMINYFLTLFPLLADFDMNTQRIPYDGSYQYAWVGALDVVLPDMEANRQFLYDTLFPDSE